MSIGNELYDDASKLGTIQALIILIVGIVIGTLLFCSVSVMYMTPDNDHETLKAEIVKADCTRYQSKDNVVYECLADVKYTVLGQEYNRQMSVHRFSPLVAGTTLEIRYNKKNPLEAEPVTVERGSLMMIMCCVGIILIGGATANYLLTKYFKLYAAGSGASLIFNFFR